MVPYIHQVSLTPLAHRVWDVSRGVNDTRHGEYVLSVHGAKQGSVLTVQRLRLPYNTTCELSGYARTARNTTIYIVLHPLSFTQTTMPVLLSTDSYAWTFLQSPAFAAPSNGDNGFMVLIVLPEPMGHGYVDEIHLNCYEWVYY